MDNPFSAHMDFAGQTALVTGGASGIGFAVARQLAGIPLDRYGTPDETAFCAVFLASEQAGYITGHILGIDGGFLAAGIMHKNPG